METRPLRVLSGHQPLSGWDQDHVVSLPVHAADWYASLQGNAPLVIERQPSRASLPTTTIIQTETEKARNKTSAPATPSLKVLPIDHKSSTTTIANTAQKETASQELNPSNADRTKAKQQNKNKRQKKRNQGKANDDVDEAFTWNLTEASAPNHTSAAICSIVRDENRYLEEWALYHLALGFEKIYLYDNSDHGSATTWLQMQDQNSILQQGVHVHPFPTKDGKRQLKAFRDCIGRFGRFHTWMALYDPDEFLVLKQHATVVDMLSELCPNGSLGINWVIFGTHNVTTFVDGPVTQRFQYHTGVDAHVKTIVKVKDYQGQKSAHWVQLKDVQTRRDTHGNWIKGKRLAGVNNPTFHPDGPIDVAALHHYKYKSLEEFNAKGCSRGYVWNQARCFNQTLEELPVGHVWDDTAWKDLQRLVPQYRDVHQDVL